MCSQFAGLGNDMSKVRATDVNVSRGDYAGAGCCCSSWDVSFSLAVSMGAMLEKHGETDDAVSQPTKHK